MKTKVKFLVILFSLSLSLLQGMHKVIVNLRY